MTAAIADLPPSLRLSWWGTGWLRGQVAPDDLLDAVVGDAVTHVVLGDRAQDGRVLSVLAAAREQGVREVAASFPAAGDPVGLRGPAAFTAAAIEAGEAVLLLGAELGLVPREVGHAVEWTIVPAARRPPPDLGDADRALRSTLLAAVQELTALDVARWNPEVADELMDLRSGVEVPAPRGTPQRAVEVAGRALHLQRVLDLALADDGAAVSAVQIAQRRAAMEPLRAGVRSALTAACSPDGWPPAIASSR